MVTWKRRVKCARAHHVRTVRRNTLCSIARDSIVATRIEEGNACQSELHVLVALAGLISRSQVMLVVAVRSGDNRCRFPNATLMRMLVTARIREHLIVIGVVAAGVSAVGFIDAVKEVVEGDVFGVCAIIANLAAHQPCTVPRLTYVQLTW